MVVLFTGSSLTIRGESHQFSDRGGSVREGHFRSNRTCTGVAQRWLDQLLALLEEAVCS